MNFWEDMIQSLTYKRDENILGITSGLLTSLRSVNLLNFAGVETKTLRGK